MLRWRLLLGTAIIAALVALCWLDFHAAVPGVWLLPVALVVTLLATHETLDLLAAAGMRPTRWLVHAANLLMVLSPWADYAEPLVRQHLTPGLADVVFSSPCSPEAAIGVFLLALFAAEMCGYRGAGHAAASIAGGVLALLYVGALLRCAVSLRMIGLGALASWIVVVKMGDVGAYTVGRLIGRHKMSPLISPGKTIEGALGALAFSCLASWLALRWLVPLCTPEAVSPGPRWGWLVYGLLLAEAGMLGDLAESLLKRDAGRKDSSTWLTGYGGVLDIVDSLLLSAPVAWLCWTFGLLGR